MSFASLTLLFGVPFLQAAPVPRADIELSSARGLAYLLRQQRNDGSFRSKYQVAAQALAGLAFLSGGHTPRHGKHAIPLRRGLRRLLRYQNQSGYFTDGKSKMYGHGFATLYLAEILGMRGPKGEEAKLRGALRDALGLIERSQSQLGGWYYTPEPSGYSDCSITVCQTMALRAARNIGLKVNERVIDKAARYIRKAQAENGGFRYQIGPKSNSITRTVTLGCSAAGVCILNALGKYETESVAEGLDYLQKHYRGNLGLFTIRSPFYYTHYYASQAFFGTRGPRWEEYYEYISEELLKRQRQDGSWADTNNNNGDAIICTAMAVFILNVPQSVLPITQK